MSSHVGLKVSHYVGKTIWLAYSYQAEVREAVIKSVRPGSIRFQWSDSQFSQDIAVSNLDKIWFYDKKKAEQKFQYRKGN